MEVIHTFPAVYSKVHSNDIGWKITYGALGTVIIGEEGHNLRDRVIVHAPLGTTIKEFQKILSVVGLCKALELSTPDDFRRIEILRLFRTFYPTSAYIFEKSELTFSLNPNELLQKIIEKHPKMKAVFKNCQAVNREILPGYIRTSFLITEKFRFLKLRALTTAITSIDPWGKKGKNFKLGHKNLRLLATILKQGLFSQALRNSFKTKKFRGLDNSGAYMTGGAESVYTQAIIKEAVKKRLPFEKLSTYGVFPIRLYLSLKSLERGSYQYPNDNSGTREPRKYAMRPSLFAFLKKELNFSHEIMLPDRVLPEEIRAIAVPNQKIKKQILTHFRSCDLIQKGINGKEEIYGIPLKKFIRVERCVSKQAVKFCS